ncbi:MAG: hypothetical protein HRJ53_01760, partial [Acidobacteria bacterium Pan2503]|nr:hypothetical protein [Candidatus Acidoferrum panamensis]
MPTRTLPSGQAIKYIDAASAGPLTAIHVVLKWSSISPILDGGGITLNWLGTAVTPSLADVIYLVSHITASINSIPTGAVASPQSYMASSLLGGTNNATAEAYDISSTLNGAPHGAPIYSTNWTLGVTGPSGACPEGMAACISIKAPYGTDVEFAPGPPPSRPRARDRGRIYFGPLNNGTIVQEATTNRTKFANTFMGDLLTWVHSIASITSTAGVVWDLGVWSRRAAILKQIIE